MSSSEPLTIKITKINNQYHCRLICNGTLIDEIACRDKRDLSFCSAHLLRWYAKMSYEPHSPMAEASRARQKINTPYGKIDYHVNE